MSGATEAAVYDLADADQPVDARLSFAHSRDMILIVARDLPYRQRVAIERRLLRMQEAFDERDNIAEAREIVSWLPRRRFRISLNFGWMR